MNAFFTRRHAGSEVIYSTGIAEQRQDSQAFGTFQKIIKSLPRPSGKSTGADKRQFGDRCSSHALSSVNWPARSSGAARGRNDHA